MLAAFAGFVGWGFATHYLPVLRLLYYAFLLGVIATLLLLVALILTTSQRSRAYDTLATQTPTIAFARKEHWQAETDRFRTDREYTPQKLYPQSFLISDALDGLVTLALRDFVSSWYKNISKDPTFVNEIDRGIRCAIAEIRDRLFREDIVIVVVSRVVPIITQHLRDFDIAERAVRGKALNRSVTESEELDMAIAAKYREGKLHPAASLTYSDTKLSEQEYLRKILVRILPEVLPESLLKSRAVSVLIKEIVACAVLFPVFQMLADPDFYNQLMEGYGRTALQDRKTVRKLRAALDEHASPVPSSKQAQAFPRLSPNDSERAFERFVRAIRRTNNLSDARRFRSQIASQLKKESMIENQDPTYIRRLQTGKRVLDQKVAKLSAKVNIAHPPRPMPDQRSGSFASQKDVSLVDVMRSASGLSYFMEYMDRQRKMALVQFWIVVDGFRNPLEDDFGDDSDMSSIQWTDTDRNDIASINEAYLSKPELKVPDESKKAVKAFLAAGRQASAEQYRHARVAILSSQSAVLEEMQHQNFPNFQKSDLWYKYLTSDEISTPGLSAQQRQLSDPVIAKPPLFPPRTTSKPLLKSKPLRRAAASSTDVRVGTKLFDDPEPRKSTDTDRSAPLFDDDYDTDPLANSTFSLGQESNNGDGNQTQMIETMQAALDTIISEDPKDDSINDSKDFLFDSPTPSLHSGRNAESARTSLDAPRLETATGEKIKPSIASLGLVNSAGRIGVFSDNDLFGDEEKFIEDEYADSEKGSEIDPDEEIHEAAPGDLGLAEAISALSADIERLVSQESVVDALTRKAELTNNVAELRILGKSKSSLQREIRRKEMQRQQYIVQESDNSLFGRATISITSVMVGKEEDGREYAMYLIEVQRKAGDQMPAASWTVARRYSEFHDLYRKIRARYPSTRELDFPRRRVVMKLQREFLHKRRLALEDYLRKLLLLPDVCRSRELRSFLSQQAILPEGTTPDGDSRDIVTRIYNSVTDGMDEFLGNIAALDQFSAAGQNLISAATSQLNTAQTGIIPDASDPKTIAEAEAELNAFEDRELEPFVKPICDIFLEAFDLNKGNNWLRGRAVVVVLHQLLGGTVERKVRDIVKSFTAEDAILKYISTIKDKMWPLPSSTNSTTTTLPSSPSNISTTLASSSDDTLRLSRPPSKLRTPTEKSKSRTEASLLLATLIPDLAGNVVGRANAQQAARKIAAMLNNRRLNTSLVFEILDQILAVLFGDGSSSAGGGVGIN